MGDTAYGAAALQLTDMLTPSVVVAGDLLGDGVIDHFLPDLVRAGTRVLLLADDLPGERVLSLVGRGLSGACSTDDALAEVADAVLAVAAGGAVLPPALVASIVTQWRSGWRAGAKPDLTRSSRCGRWRCSTPWPTGCPPRPPPACLGSP